MKEEDKSYIEAYLSKVIGICINLSYTRDRLGNVTFKDRERLVNNINRLIVEADSKLEASEDEIRNYLIETYRKKSTDPEYRVETQEFISVLESMQENKEEQREIKIEEVVK